MSCSKNTNKDKAQDSPVTGSVIDESPEACRLSDESDCRPIEIKRGEQENEAANNNDSKEILQIENDTKINIKKTNISKEGILSCEEGWKCIEGTKYRAYQYTNCSWTSIERCVYGCKESACRLSLLCKPASLKCSNDVVMRCNEDGSEWLTNQSCDYHCENGIRMAKNETGIINQSQNNQSQINQSQINDYIKDKCIAANVNATDEYFTLKNACSYTIDMTNWTAKDEAKHTFKFPSFSLGANAGVIVYTGAGTNSLTELYWGLGSSVWNNDNDTLYLNNSMLESVLVYSYILK